MSAGLVLLAATAGAQTLARPGWAGSGMSAEPWWKRAVVYDADVRSLSAGLKGVTARLDFVQSLGVDALAVGPLNAAGAGCATVDAKLGTEQDFTELLREAGRRRVRVLVHLRWNAATDGKQRMLDCMRVWMDRGVAGFELDAANADAAGLDETLRAMRKAVNASVGQRVLAGEAPATDATGLAKMIGRGDEMQLPADTALGFVDRLDAARLRTLLTETQTKMNGNLPLLLFDDAQHTSSRERYAASGANPDDIERVLAAILLGTRDAAQLTAAQVLTPEEMGAKGDAAAESDAGSLRNWVRRLVTLRKSSAALLTGSQTFFDHDTEGALVWVRRPAAVSADQPAVVVACNLTGRAVTLSLKDDLKRAGLHGFYLRTLARTDQGMGAMDLEAVRVPAWGVYVGELHR
jgi:hypothetical protein